MPISYRVGNVDNTSDATGWVKEEFGIDANLLGHLTPQAVRQMSLDANEMKKQIQMANVFVKASKQIMDGKVEIEKLRKDLLEQGLASKEEVDGIVKQMILLTEKHKGHIAKMLQEMQQGKALIGAKFKSDSELSRSGFQNKLRELKARHQSSLREMDESSRESMQKIISDRAKSKQNAAASRRFTEYLTADNESHRRFEVGNGRRPASLMAKAPMGDRGGSTFGKGKGLLGRLFG